MTQAEKLALQIAVDCLRLIALPAGGLSEEETRLEALMRQAAETALRRIEATRGGGEREMSKATIAGRPFAEIEEVLADLPGTAYDVPANIGSDTILRGIFATVVQTNYLLATILIELRENRKRN